MVFDHFEEVTILKGRGGGGGGRIILRENIQISKCAKKESVSINT